MTTPEADLLANTIPLLLGGVTTYLMTLLTKLSSYVDQMPPLQKKLTVTVLSYLIVKLSTLLSIALPGDIHAWTGDTVNTAIVTVISFGLYHLRQSNQEKATS
jgi:hypothetical protein